MTLLNLWALWLLVPVALLYFFANRSSKFAKTPLHKDIVLDKSENSWLHRAEIAALALLVLALARPVAQSRSVVENRSYDPIYLAIDLSASMQARDREPSRLEYSKRVVKEILKRDKSHRFGLFGFTTNALILSPATRDKNLVDAALESINPEFIITHGTDIVKLLETVSKTPEESKRLVILSDGGDSIDLKRAVQIAAEGGVKVYIVAAGTDKGALIPKSGGGFVRDGKGRLVISMQNRALEQLAAETGGEVVESDDPAEAASELLSLFEDEDLLTSTYSKVEVTELFWIPLSAALFLFFISVVRLPEGLKKRLFLLFSALLPLKEADAGVLELWRLHEAYTLYEKGEYNQSLEYIESVEKPSLQRLFAKASALYKIGAYKEAGRILSSIKSDDPNIKSIIYYDLGNCAVKLGRYKSARVFYTKSLQLLPDDDALENLSLILFLRERKTKKPKSAANRKVEASGVGERMQKSGSKSKKESHSSGGKSGGSGGSKAEVNHSSALSAHTLKRPLGSKAYELINKGYIDEPRPW